MLNTAKDRDEVLGSAENRVQDLFLKLNLGKDVVRSEVAKFQNLRAQSSEERANATK